MSLSLLPGLLAVHLAATGPETFPAAFFAPYAPQTALDMVQRLPGFRLDLGDEGVRGFTEVGGNVLVDGARPTSKTGGLSAALSAIPARQVARIEILRGRASVGDASGQAMVANIVRVTRQGGLAVSGQLSMADGHSLGEVSITLTRPLGGFDLASRTSFDASGERSHGARTQFTLSDAATGQQALDYRTDYPELSQRVMLEGDVAGGRLKASALLAGARLSETFAFVDAAHAERFPKHTDRTRGEVSGAWTPPVAANYALELLGLTGFTDLDARSDSQGGVSPAALETTDRFETRSRSHETIARGILKRDAQSAWRPEIGIELARNDLDSRSVSTSLGQAPSRSAAVVSEVRVNGFATLDWRPASRWTVAAGLAYETSRIHAEGGQARRFGFLKPRLTVSYAPDERSQLRISARRSVGQLSFSDFAASADPAQGKIYGGNVALRPDHRTTVALDYDRRFGRRGAFNLDLFHDWRADVLEAAVLPGGAFGLVNVDRACVWGASANLELPVNHLAPGGLVKLSYAWQGSRIADPLTGARRGITALRPETVKAAFRQDRALLSWGVDYALGYGGLYWYADEARRLRHAQDLSLYVETVRFAAAKVRLQLDGLTGTRNTYSRTLYAPNRAGTPYQKEVWRIRTPIVATLTASRNF